MKTKRLIKNATLCALVMVLGGSLFMTPLFADSYDSFSVTPNLPENQYDSKAEYFDLLLTENQEQTITIDIENKGNEDMIAYLEINNGSTGDNGSKQYMVNKEPDVSMKHPLTTLASLENDQIEVKAGETKQAVIKVKAPEQAFDGVVLGGVRIYANTLEDTPSQSTDSITIDNQLNYMVAIQLHMNDATVERNLNLLGVGTKLTGYQPTITATIQNDQAILMNGVSIEGTITQKGSSKVIGSVHQDNRGIMPNTNFNVVYQLEDTNLKSGDYEVNLKITHEDKVWEWKEDLTVSQGDADDLNDQAIFDKKETNWWMIATIGLLGTMGLFLFIILFKRRKKDDEEEK